MVASRLDGRVTRPDPAPPFRSSTIASTTASRRGMRSFFSVVESLRIFSRWTGRRMGQVKGSHQRGRRASCAAAIPISSRAKARTSLACTTVRCGRPQSCETRDQGYSMSASAATSRAPPRTATMSMRRDGETSFAVALDRTGHLVRDSLLLSSVTQYLPLATPIVCP